MSLSSADYLTDYATIGSEHTTSANGKGKDILDNNLICVGTSSAIKESTCRDIIRSIRENTQDLSMYNT